MPRRISAVTKSGRKLSSGEIAEREVTKQVKDFLQYRNWRVVRMMRTVLPGSFQTGEPGQADVLALRFLPESRVFTATLALWIEFKRPGGKLSDIQVQWHRNERLRGGTVWVVDDFERFAVLYDKHFGWLHSGDAAIGQLDLLAPLREC